MPLKAIQTEYKGYLFRSRLEARWAVFLDRMGIPFTYEPEGFDLDGTWYLPDFHCNVVEGCWIEVKPKAPSLKAKALAAKLSRAARCPVLILIGQPWLKQLHIEGYDSGIELRRSYAWRFFWALIVLSQLRNVLLFAWAHRRRPWLDLWRVEEALEAARQARFEHGETPQ